MQVGGLLSLLSNCNQKVIRTLKKHIVVYAHRLLLDIEKTFSNPCTDASQRFTIVRSWLLTLHLSQEEQYIFLHFLADLKLLKKHTLLKIILDVILCKFFK